MFCGRAADHSHGMIDIHSHILPGLDDGARDPEEALNMVRLAASAGTTDIVATPHADERFRFDPPAVQERIAELQLAAGPTPRIHYGCELHVTAENIADALRFPYRYAIAGRAYVLIEFSDFLVPKTTTEILGRLLDAGVRPIVAHPERNPLLRRRIADLETWVERGCLLQLTAQSLVGRFGRSAQAGSEELLRRNLVHVVASDGHDTRHRPPVLEEGWQYLERHFGALTARRLLIDNPQAVLDGEAIEEPAAVPRRKSRFAFW